MTTKCPSIVRFIRWSGLWYSRLQSALSVFCMCRFLSWLHHFWFSSLLINWKKQLKMGKCLRFCYPIRNLKWNSCFWFWSYSPLAFVDIWELNQEKEVFSLYLCNSDFQIEKGMFLKKWFHQWAIKHTNKSVCGKWHTWLHTQSTGLIKKSDLWHLKLCIQ